MKIGLRLALARLALCDTDVASNASMEFGKSTVLFVGGLFLGIFGTLTLPA